MRPKENGISVIVCCYNSATRIIATMEHLVAQEVPNDVEWEIILINNNSTDNTASVAQEFMASNNGANIPFKVVDEKEPGLSNARNKGFSEAKYEIVLMVDDDNSLAPNYVAGIYKGFDNEDVGMVGGLGIPALEEEPPIWFSDYAYCFAVGEQNPEEHLYGAGLGLRMSALEKIRNAGFKSLLSDRTGNNLMSGGDTELCFAFRMAGYKLRYLPELTFKHHLPIGRINWSYMKRLFSGFGQSKAFMEVYTAAISGKQMPDGNESNFWKNRASYLFSQLKSDLPLLFRSKFSSLEGNEQLLLAIAKQGHWRKVKELKEEYYNNFKTVYELHESLKSIKN